MKMRFFSYTFIITKAPCPSCLDWKVLLNNLSSTVYEITVLYALEILFSAQIQI